MSFYEFFRVSQRKGIYKEDHEKPPSVWTESRACKYGVYSIFQTRMQSTGTTFCPCTDSRNSRTRLQWLTLEGGGSCMVFFINSFSLGCPLRQVLDHQQGVLCSGRCVYEVSMIIDHLQGSPQRESGEETMIISGCPYIPCARVQDAQFRHLWGEGDQQGGLHEDLGQSDITHQVQRKFIECKRIP